MERFEDRRREIYGNSKKDLDGYCRNPACGWKIDVLGSKNGIMLIFTGGTDGFSNLSRGKQ